ncbi:MAG TPA: P-loop NTPase fold protein [Bacteroidia bacterium]|jgi:hypothetical protein|nr:P-loop NTPase fold protein [Bacteroidia bacterium]
MPYKTEKRLEGLIQQALKENEIANALNANRLIRETHLTKPLTEQPETAWTVALEDILNYDNTENEISDIKYKYPKYFSRDAGLSFTKTAERVDVFAGAAVLFFIILVIWTFVSHSGNNWPDTITTLRSSWIYVSMLIIVVLFTIASIALKFGVVSNKKTWENEKEELDKKVGLTSLENRIIAMDKAIDTSILEKAIKPRMRAIINESLKASYSNLLGVIEAPGLSEVVNPSQTINTLAQSRLDFLFNNMPGGSIGIAGPRGAGKSTLIQNYCGTQRTVERIKDKKILPVFTSAPVEYDTRDFILHLFASTCYSLLKQEGVQNPSINFEELNKSSSDPYKLISANFLETLKDICSSFGLLFIFLSAIIVVSGNPALFHIEPISRVNPFLLLDIKAGDVFKLGLLLTFISFFIQKKTGGSWGSYISEAFQNINPLKAASRLVYRLFRGSKSIEEEENKKKEIKIEKPTISQIAIDKLQKIKFQQTFTSGWSGSLKASVLEGEINSAITFAEKQMTNPEIIQEFTEFLTVIPLEYQIVIGIDELDKMESDQQAQKFLNEIKSLFGLPRCFYLISVSENAMSNFERRGLPFRDVFDSSFDSIVYVDYFNIDESADLLSRRVIGKPLPFFYLSYCLSGGLPRDLIRAFRQITEIKQKEPKEMTLDSITLSIIISEIKLKMRALNFVAKKSEGLPETEKLIELLFNLQNEIISGEILITYLKELKKWRSGEHLKMPCPEKLQPLKENILRLFDEVTGYIFLMITFLEFFSRPVTEQNITKSVTDGDFRKLAMAKQAMATNSLIAKKMIKDFRESHNMALLN